MKTTCFPMITLLLVSVLGCAAKSLDGGSNDGGPKGDGGSSGAPSGGTSAAGESCDADGSCVEGLSCLAFSVHPPGEACRVVGKQCTKPCAAGADGGANCVSMGPKYLCFKGCGDDFVCGGTL